MEITINGNVTINQNSQGQQEERKPLDRTNEVLISNDTSFSDLIRILRGRPEALAASRIEAEEKEREAEEERKRKAFGDDYDLMSDGQDLEKADRRPGAAQLRLFEPMVAKIEFISGGFCEVFTNGYAVYDNGNRKCVVWVPDCGSATYYFGPLKEKEKEYLDQKKELSEDDLGPLPWYHALMIAGEDRIEYNMEHPKSKGSASDTENPEEWESKANYRWSCGAHFDSPEEAYLKKEAAEERRKALTEKQREAYVMYYEQGYTQEEIANILGIAQQSVQDRLNGAVKKFGDKEKFFF